MKLGQDTVAVVTGGASGLGASAARLLASRGVRVAIFDLRETAGRSLASEIGGHFFPCDVSHEASVVAALTAARSLLGQERILVNCAGVAIAKRGIKRAKDTGEVVPHDLESFARCITVNLMGTFLMATKCAAGMVQAMPLEPDGERGVIINTSSIAAEDGQSGQVAYAASKGGVRAMTLPLARDLAKDGIRVVTIMPGLFDTPMFDGLPDDARQALAAQVPFPARLGNPDEFAMLVLHICENSLLNGASIRLDGALRLAPR